MALSFVPPSTSTVRPRAQKKGKQITRHRLLTSEDIISGKKLKLKRLNKTRKLKKSKLKRTESQK
jgi:hypothetical protein